MNSSTIEVMWEPPSNDSCVDFYQYQLIDNLTEVIVSNTTNTTAVLSGIPYNVNMSFVISAHNCDRPGQQATIVINIGKLWHYTEIMHKVFAILYHYSNTIIIIIILQSRSCMKIAIHSILLLL